MVHTKEPDSATCRSYLRAGLCRFHGISAREHKELLRKETAYGVGDMEKSGTYYESSSSPPKRLGNTGAMVPSTGCTTFRDGFQRRSNHVCYRSRGISSFLSLEASIKSRIRSQGQFPNYSWNRIVIALDLDRRQDYSL